MDEAEGVTVLGSADETRDAIRTLVETAERSAVVAIPGAALPEFRGVLRDAIERDVLVVLLLCRWPGRRPLSADLDAVATVARATPGDVPTYCIVDDLHGLIADTWVLDPDESSAVQNWGTIVHDNDVAYSMFGEYVGNFWQQAEEVVRPAPAPLPLPVGEFRRFVLQAFAHLQAGTPLCAHVRLTESEDRDTIAGQVVNVRQSLVYPITSVIPVQSALVLDDDGERTTVGGPGAYIEDYSAIDGRLEAR